MDEAMLVRQAQGGDREAFAQLVRLHQERLRGLVALSIPGHDDVHDLVQEAFVDAWRGLPGFDTGRDFAPWLRTICRNRVRKFLRDRLPRRRRELALVDEALLAAPEPPEDDRRLPALRACLGRLAEGQRRLLARRYRDGEPVQAIAEAIGRSPNAVSMLLLRLRSALVKCVAERLAEAQP